MALKDRMRMPQDSEERDCFYGRTTDDPGIEMMFEGGALRRIDLGPSARTGDGIKVGDKVAHVRKFYGARLRIAPHHYTGPQEKYLTLRFKRGRLATRFETDKGRISSIYSGAWKQVQYVEGCL